jgi:hypothetical protein
MESRRLDCLSCCEAGVFFNKISQVVCGGAYVGVASLVTVDVSNLEALWVRGYFVETVLSSFIGAARCLN